MIRIEITEADVTSIAAEKGIDEDTALERAYSWAKAIEETASTLVNEQLASAIEHDQP